MPYQLIFRTPDGERLVEFDTVLVVGRDSEDCDVAITNERLSRRHAEFVVTAEGVIVRDLGSRNGVSLNGCRVAEGLVRPGDHVLLGDIGVTVRAPRSSSSASGFTSASGASASAPAPEGVPAPDLDKTIRLPKAPSGAGDQTIRLPAPAPAPADLDQTIRLPKAPSGAGDQTIRLPAPAPAPADLDQTIRLPKAPSGAGDQTIRLPAPGPASADLDQTIRLPKPPPAELVATPAVLEPQSSDSKDLVEATAPFAQLAPAPMPEEPRVGAPSLAVGLEADASAGPDPRPVSRGGFGGLLVGACLASSALTSLATAVFLRLGPESNQASSWLGLMPGAVFGLLAGLALAVLLHRSLARRIELSGRRIDLLDRTGKKCQDDIVNL